MNVVKRLSIATVGAALVVLGITGTAKAATTTLTFEGIGDQQPVGNFYSSEGITFSPNALALVSDQAGGSGNFDAASPPSPDTIVYFTSGSAATLNAPNGFTTGFSFYYSAINQPGSINVYSGLNDTGTLLATLNLPTTLANPPGRFQPFVPIGVSFNGTAESVDFGGTVNQIGFDNITLGSSTPTSSVPEPSDVLGTLAFGVMGVGYVLKRKLQQKFS